MLVKALVSFAGKISMGAGDTREVSNEKIAKDLLRAGYVTEVKPKAEKPKVEAVAPKEETEKAPKKRAKRSSKKK